MNGLTVELDVDTSRLDKAMEALKLDRRKFLKASAVSVGAGLAAPILPPGPWSAHWARAAEREREEAIVAKTAAAPAPPPGISFPINFALATGPRIAAGHDAKWFPLVPMEGD